MPQLKRWIVARKMVNIFSDETLKKLIGFGANFGGGWNEIHQHINVSPKNREDIINLLEKEGYLIEEPDTGDINKTRLENHNI